MENISMVGLDLGKRFFQVHCADDRGKKLLNRRLRRDQIVPFFESLPRVAMETCAGAHHWGRVLSEMGYEVKLIPAQYVKPYVKSNKNDAADAEAICEAAQRPEMRFAAVKSKDAQGMLSLHRTRKLLVKQRTQMVNSIRGQCAEFGVIAPQNRTGVNRLIEVIRDDNDDRLPDEARLAMKTLVDLLDHSWQKIAELEKALKKWHREVSQQLERIPGVGVITATALTAALGDGKQFRNGRQFSASLGLVPRQDGTGGKVRLGRISKRGDSYLRGNLIHGARSVINWRLRKDGPGSPHLKTLVEKKSVNQVAVAIANRNARVAWAMVRNGESYRPRTTESSTTQAQGV